MKGIHRLSLVLYIIAGAFAAGLLIFCVKYAAEGWRWVSFPSNRHIYSNGRVISSGDILDQDGDMLLGWENGARAYGKTQSIRLGTLHILGDRDGNIIGVQRAYMDVLSGYNPLTGLYPLTGEARGGDIYLTLDDYVCGEAARALDGRAGAIGLYNYKTGEILCVTSSPSFDPASDIVIDISEPAYEGVYINRLISAAYPPGSTFKMVTAAAALENGVDPETWQYECTGQSEYDGGIITCPRAHGRQNLTRAMVNSCNCAFAALTHEIGARALTEQAQRLGLTAGGSIERLDVAPGSFDVNGADGAQLGWAGVGQYTDLVTPFHMMLAMGGVANGGIMVGAKIIGDIHSPLGINVNPRLFAPSSKRVMSEKTALALTVMLKACVDLNYGQSGFGGLTVCAKTGTAQVGGGKSAHAWLAGFALDEDCPLAFVVLIEHGGAGSEAAVPAARRVLTAAAASVRSGGQ